AMADIPEATTTSRAPAVVDTPTQRSASSCDSGQTLEEVRAALPADELAVHYNVSRGVTSLVIWSVDAEIPVPMVEAQLSESADQAWVHAGRMAIAAVEASECVRELFDAIDAVVVDREYAGWLSGQVRIADIPYDATANEINDSFLAVLDQFNVTYLRQTVVQDVPQGTCDWPEARQNIWQHFSPDRLNIAFYYTIDEFGGNVWAQWDGPPDEAMLIASMMNVMLGLECFNPQANIIAMIVDEAGNMIRIAVVPQMNMAEIQISTP
ncbi:MAG: hypothetical protein PVG63_04400, partial [Anaerolineales bacterium]